MMACFRGHVGCGECVYLPLDTRVVDGGNLMVVFSRKFKPDTSRSVLTNSFKRYDTLIGV